MPADAGARPSDWAASPTTTAPELSRAPAPGDLAAQCHDCGSTAEPWHVAYSGGPFATAGYRCECGRQWILRWADDETTEGAAALAAAGVIPDGSGVVAP